MGSRYGTNKQKKKLYIYIYIYIYQIQADVSRLLLHAYVPSSLNSFLGLSRRPSHETQLGPNSEQRFVYKKKNIWQG
ncbi:hypothetical protein CKAN_02172600 [Cinnamomum micranthum f. kanehirae]|uniref:Uncharacterized protein n=1 Tax=Cinnamomum micranthum f. kanehirae TaxID=337451 RepID=A0A443PP01_9MAGN|nr:hypothetical protein CKAN_02172600 [Cinnamomum micranthum f. kanehirae]